MPEISKFEVRIIDLQQGVDNLTEIVRRFDEILLQKVDKTSHKQLEGNISQNYVSK